MSHYTIHQDDDTSKPVHTYRWSLLKDGNTIGEFFTQADAETIRAALNGENERALIDKWRAQADDNEPDIAEAEQHGLLVTAAGAAAMVRQLRECADELQASIAQQDTRQPTAEQER